MMMERGFSLSEIIISLLLLTGLSLALCKQQWQMNRIMNQVLMEERLELDASNKEERQQGLSLIELLFGLMLSIGILLIVIQHHLQIKEHLLKAQTRIHQASRLELVLDLMRSSAHQAGFSPCLPLSQLRTIDPQTHRPLKSIEANHPKAAVLMMHRMNVPFTIVTHIQGKHHLDLAPGSIIHAQRPLLIADCQSAEVIQNFSQEITPHGMRLHLQDPLTFAYHTPIYIGEWLEESFEIRKNKDAQSALFYHLHHTDELMPGVISLQYQIQDNMLHLDLKLDHENPIALDIWLRSS